MPLEITFSLSDRDLDQFQSIVDKAKSAMGDKKDDDQIAATAKKMIADARSTNLPDFIAERLNKLETIVRMVEDNEWQLNSEDCSRVLHALLYFNDPDDLIPDHIPGIGFLDDAIYIELVIGELQAEIDSFEEFCAFRDAEEKRRVEKGLDPHVAREEWLADKRAALHSRMHKRRRVSGGGWRLRW